jgi:hypothetical protein
MKRTSVLRAIAVVLAAIWFFFTPHLAANAMRTAAQERDSAKLSGYVDFPALKESLKGSFNAKLAAGVATDADNNAFAALGAAMAAALINPMIDARVTVTKRGEEQEPVGLVLRRDGVFSWKLSAIRMSL